MPELPEVETVVRGLRKAVLGQSIKKVLVRRENLRFPFPSAFAARLTGRRLQRIERRGKYIVIHLDQDLLWLCHLGMSGSMVIRRAPPEELQKHDHVLVEMNEGTWLTYNDARRFGMMDLIPKSQFKEYKLFKGLGPEPLSANFNPEYLEAILKGAKVSIKAALLDQKRVVGVGNIYASEALFRAGIRPTRQAGSLKKGEIRELTRAIKEVLEDAIKAGGSSLRNYVQTNGELGYFQHRWKVYGKEGEPCPGCICQGQKKGGIKRIEQSGRSSFYCPARQF